MPATSSSRAESCWPPTGSGARRRTPTPTPSAPTSPPRSHPGGPRHRRDRRRRRCDVRPRHDQRARDPRAGRLPGPARTSRCSIGPWKGVAAWDVSTGDPIVPSPRQVTIDRILGEPITLLGYAPETIIAEKGVTILERGITSTRWRDYVDIVELARQGIDPDELLRSARAVARTAASPSNPSHHTWPVMAQSHKRNGPHGAARNTSNLSAKRTSTTRSPWSPPTLIPSSLTAPNRQRHPHPAQPPAQLPAHDAACPQWRHDDLAAAVSWTSGRGVVRRSVTVPSRGCGWMRLNRLDESSFGPNPAVVVDKTRTPPSLLDSLDNQPEPGGITWNC